ncbi:unnamed protein product [Closterium sp. NIES-53]
MELAIISNRIFGIGNENLGIMEQERPTPHTETLRWILEEANTTTFDEESRLQPYPRDVYRTIDKAWKDPDAPEELSVQEEEEKEKDGELVAGGTQKEGHLPKVTSSKKKSRNSREREMAAEIPPPRVGVPLGRRPRNLPSPPRSPYIWRSSWSEIEEGNVPATPHRDSLGPISRPDPFARLIKGTRTALNIIPDRNFLALYLTIELAEVETVAKPEAEEQDNEGEPGEEGPMLDIPQETEAEAAEYHARYLCTPGVCAEDDLGHQRLGHPSLQTFNNCPRTKVLQPRALLRPNDTEPLSTSHPTTCTVCPTTALTHQAYPSLEPSTNCYKKLQNVYSNYIMLTFEGINGENNMLTFVDAYSRCVWIANVDVRSKAPESFRIWLAHAQRESGKKLKIWQTDGTKEFCSYELEGLLTEKGIKNQISLFYAHQQQGVTERVNRTLMTKATAAALDRDPADEHPGVPPRPRDDDDYDDSDDAPVPGPSRCHAPPSISPPAHKIVDDDVVEVTATEAEGTSNITGLQLLGRHTTVTTIA